MQGTFISGSRFLSNVMLCEMCGKDVPSLRRAVIEGSAMSVCGGCVRFGVAVVGAENEITGRSRAVDALDRRAKRAQTKDIYTQMEAELVPEYAQMVRDARVRRGLTPEQLSEKLKESRTTIAQLERNELRPSDTLVKKLERELGLKLMEKPDYVPTTPKKTGGASGFTLGDMIRDAQKKQK